MCGIVGILVNEMGTVERADLKRMCSLLAHRGPDDEGYYFGDRIGLGIRRLAVIDVQSGRQPIHNEDQSVWVVFNGEIYNYQEIRKNLEKRGHRFYTSSDTECLVHLYEEFGEDCVSHLRGMFAFGIWDTRRRKLLLARDRLGIKPLYYCHWKDQFLFASEMKSLLAVDGFERRMNLEALSDYFTFMYVPGPMTIYEGIFELPPAHTCVWSNGNVSLRRYWEVTPKPDNGKSIEYFTEGLIHHLRDAVKLRLISDVSLGAFLSGGIDSSAVVAIMGEISRCRVRTFTVGFESNEPVFDERPFARRLAESLGTDHSEILLSTRIQDILPAIIRAFDEPFADSSMIPNFLICQAARQFVTVALSGLGGDELFAGYERYRGAMLGDYYRKVPRVFRHGVVDPLMRLVPESRNGGLWGNRVKRFMQGTDLGLAERYQRYISAYDESEKDQLFSRDLAHELARRGVSPTRVAMQQLQEELSPLYRMLFTDLHTYLPHDLLKMTDRLSMYHSLEVRVPFLDHKLVEFSATIPAHYKLKWWRKKYILIRAFDGILPKAILKRRKQGFSIPLSKWLRGPLRDITHAYLAEPLLQDIGLFDHRVVGKIIKEHERGTRNRESQIWTLLTFMLWHQAYIHKQTHA